MSVERKHKCPTCERTSDVVRLGEMCPFCTASPAAAVPEGALPPLLRYKLMPGDAREWLVPAEDGPWCKYEHATAYARAAVEADRVRQQDMSVRLAGAPAGQRDATITLLRNTVDLQHSTIVKLEATLADRAQQGEPLACRDCEGKGKFIDCGGFVAEVCPTCEGSGRAATKAAAPADAPAVTVKMVNIKTGQSSDWNVPRAVVEEAGRAAPAPDTGIPTAGEVEKAGWISVEDDLPEPGERVLVTRFAGRVGNAEHPGHPGVPWVEVTRYMVNCSMFECDLLSTGNVTHWMRIAAAPHPSEAKAAPRTYMTDEQAEKWAWEQVKRDVGTKGWTAGESGTYYGFFLWGWRYREQYERQRGAKSKGEV